MTQLINGDLRNKAEESFHGFVGNEEAVYAIKRILLIALFEDPPSLKRVLLLTGAPSTGKTEIARRMAKCLGMPVAQMDGRNVSSRDALATLMQEALAGANISAPRTGTRSGLPVRTYPAMLVFIDEAHLIAPPVQQTLLTLLEASDRTAVVKTTEDGKFVMDASQVGFIFATTKPSLFDGALRTRLTEIALQRYKLEQVTEMLSKKFSYLPAETLVRIAQVSRLTPRSAFDIARDVSDEMATTNVTDSKTALKQIMRERGIVTANGLTHNDVRYMRVLQKEQKPVAARIMLSLLSDIPSDSITDDVEPFLLASGLIRVREKGRILTLAGHNLLNQLAEAQL